MAFKNFLFLESSRHTALQEISKNAAKFLICFFFNILKRKTMNYANLPLKA